MLYAEMLEVAGYFTAVRDGGQNSHVSSAELTLSHIDFKDFRQHFAPAGVFRGQQLAKEIYHAGRSHDVEAPLAAMNLDDKLLPLVALGFSLGAIFF